MYPFLRSSFAGPVAITSIAIWGAFALLVMAIGPSTKVAPMATVVPAIDQNEAVISLADAEALQVSTAKSDRLPWPPLAEPEPAIKLAEATDYVQAESEKRVRRAHAESPDLCERHGMHKVWTKDGRSWRCRR
jgi:hypothetical protein